MFIPWPFKSETDMFGLSKKLRPAVANLSPFANQVIIIIFYQERIILIIKLVINLTVIKHFQSVMLPLLARSKASMGCSWPLTSAFLRAWPGILFVLFTSFRASIAAPGDSIRKSSVSLEVSSLIHRNFSLVLRLSSASLSFFPSPESRPEVITLNLM